MIYYFFQTNYKKLVKFCAAFSVMLAAAFAFFRYDNDTAVPFYEQYTENRITSNGSRYARNTYGEDGNLSSPVPAEFSASANQTGADDSSLPATADFGLNNLHAKYACLMDGENNRVLVGKNENEAVPMASTTKIMTCVIALEYGVPDLKCTASSYAASMPDVQLNLKKGEHFSLRDLLHSLMLKSHNDSAVVIAENVACHYIRSVKAADAEDILGIRKREDLAFLEPLMTSEDGTDFIAKLSTDQSKSLVSVFTALMNKKAELLGCTNTYFITPNGLDAENEHGTHSTTAKELAMIMNYCIQNDEFLKITRTKNYSFGPYSLSNTNAFFDMYPDILSGKTGFTGNAGYCYVCAYQKDGRTFIVTLLACGWPNNKTYKWQDAKLLLNHARSSYFPAEIVGPADFSRQIRVCDGLSDYITVSYNETVSALICEADQINVTISLPETISAPVNKGQRVGEISVYINDSLFHTIPVYSNESVIKKDFRFYLKAVLDAFLFTQRQ